MLLDRNKKLVIVGCSLIVFLIAVTTCIKNIDGPPAPIFRNGDMIIHTLSEREGQVIDNTYKFNKKSKCWIVRVKFKSDAKKANTITNKIGIFIANTPLTFNEFELERK